MVNADEPQEPSGFTHESPGLTHQPDPAHQSLEPTPETATAVSRSLRLVTGIALILLPLVAWAFKLVSIGWLVVIIMFGPIILLLIGYVLQIIVAAQGFLRRINFFGDRSRHATIAGWSTSISVVLLAIFIPDGGDMDYGSTLQVWLGAYGPHSDAVHAATDTLTMALAIIAAAVWLATWVWLIIEWIIALKNRSLARRRDTQHP